jgi:hypothetical protein
MEVKAFSIAALLIVLIATPAMAQRTGGRGTTPSRSAPAKSPSPAQSRQLAQPGSAGAGSVRPAPASRRGIIDALTRRSGARSPGSNSSGRAADASAASLLRQFDSNRDQKLSSAEFNALARRSGTTKLRLRSRNFREIDTNKDGSLNQAELRRHIDVRPGG